MAIQRVIRPKPTFFAVAFIEFVASAVLAALHYDRMDDQLGLAMYVIFLCTCAAILLIALLACFPMTFSTFYLTFFSVETVATSSMHMKAAQDAEAEPELESRRGTYI